MKAWPCLAARPVLLSPLLAPAPAHAHPLAQSEKRSPPIVAPRPLPRPPANAIGHASIRGPRDPPRRAQRCAALPTRPVGRPTGAGVKSAARAPASTVEAQLGRAPRAQSASRVMSGHLASGRRKPSQHCSTLPEGKRARRVARARGCSRTRRGGGGGSKLQEGSAGVLGQDLQIFKGACGPPRGVALTAGAEGAQKQLRCARRGALRWRGPLGVCEAS